MSDSHARIQKMVSENRVMLFMKGNPDAPQCGFSAVVANVMKDSQHPFASFDVLSDPTIRQGIKEFGSLRLHSKERFLARPQSSAICLQTVGAS